MIKKIAILVLANLSAPVASFAAGPILARALGPAGRGDLASVSTAWILLLSLFSVGLPDAAGIVVARDGTDSRTILFKLKSSFALLGAGAVATGILYKLIFLGHLRQSSWYFVLGVGLIPIAVVFATARGCNQGAARLNRLSMEIYSNSFGRLALLGILAISGELTVWSAYAATVVPFVLAGVWLVLPLPVGSNNSVSGRELHRLSRASWLAQMAGQASFRLDQAVMLPFVGSTNLGFYAAAVTMTQSVALLAQAIQSALFARTAKGSAAELVALISRSLILFLLLTISIGTTLAGPLVHLLLGADFLPAVGLVRLLLVASLSNSLAILGLGSLVAIARPAYAAKAQGIGIVITVVGLAVLVPTVGTIGAAAVSLVSYSAIAVIAFRFFARESGEPLTSFLVPRARDVLDFYKLLRGERVKST